MITAVTRELDDIDAALEALFSQLDLPHTLKKNAVGLITCDSEFVNTGVVAALGKKLPFDTVGITTRLGASKGLVGPELLSVAVLTSDDVEFSAVLSQPLSVGNVEGPVCNAYNEALATLSGSPALVLAYPPLMPEIGSGPIVESLRKVSGKTPVFGTLSCDETIDFSTCKTIYNGTALPDAMALVLLRGAVHPRFFVTAIPEKNLQKQYAIITEADAFTVKKVNDMPFVEYLATIGILLEHLQGTYTIPFIVDFADGSKPVARGLYSITEDGDAIFGGEMPEGATISIGSLDYEGIIETAKTTAYAVRGAENAGGVLMYSCLSRNIILGTKSNDELKEVIDILGDGLAYQVCYSGGEICPVETTTGALVNRMHNYTFIACVF